jgi:hypothetical protein
MSAAGRLFLALLAVGALLAGARAAPAADLHQLWDQRCGGCHGHAGPFARKSLTAADGVLRGKTDGRDIRLLLDKHNGGYGKDDIAAIYDMLLAQVRTPNLFKAKCGQCHATAAQLVREQVVARDGVLYGRYSQRRLADYLPRHGHLSPSESKTLLDALARVEAEVHRP